MFAQALACLLQRQFVINPKQLIAQIGNEAGLCGQFTADGFAFVLEPLQVILQFGSWFLGQGQGGQIKLEGPVRHDGIVQLVAHFLERDHGGVLGNGRQRAAVAPVQADMHPFFHQALDVFGIKIAKRLEVIQHLADILIFQVDVVDALNAFDHFIDREFLGGFTTLDLFALEILEVVDAGFDVFNPFVHAGNDHMLGQVMMLQLLHMQDAQLLQLLDGFLRLRGKGNQGNFLHRYDHGALPSPVKSLLPGTA
ncbi:MAG: hypothetical protein BWY57_00584 [Betaproteobacteria bacterium ADurb.Bin341]|nr:MAG: hypothetical protein BWY57_00584 [Betaproteobacteria bacterium ADurb.Bin341]